MLFGATSAALDSPRVSVHPRYHAVKKGHTFFPAAKRAMALRLPGPPSSVCVRETVQGAVVFPRIPRPEVVGGATEVFLLLHSLHLSHNSLP